MKKFCNLNSEMEAEDHSKNGINIFTVIVIAVLFSVSPASHAQSPFSFGVRAGLNRIDMLWGQVNDKQSGFQIGAVTNYAISNKFSVEPEILFIITPALRSERTQIDASTGQEIDRALIENPNKYIQIPVRVRYRLGNKLILQAGPYFGLEFGGKCEKETTVNGIKHSVIYTPKEYYEQHKRLPNDKYKPFDWGFGAGVTMQLNKNMQVGIEINRRVNEPKLKSLLIPAKGGSFSFTATYMFGKNKHAAVF